MLLFVVKSQLILVLSFLLLGSLFLNLFMFNRSRDYELKINNATLNPVQLKRYQKDFVKNEIINVNKTRVVFLGDSRAFTWTEPVLKNFQFFNRGINGETSAKTLLRFDEHVSYLKPDIIVLQICINDLRMRPLPSETSQDVVENCKRNIQQLVKKSQVLNATLILTTILPLGRGDIPWQWKLKRASENAATIDKGITEVNTYIRSLNEKDNVIVFDAYKELEENGRTKDNYSKDLLHINKDGYQKLNQKLVPVLEQLEKR